MKDYVSPKAELITFKNETILTDSACNCSFWQVTNDMDKDEPGCMARSAHASENPNGIAAPDYGNW